MGQTEIVFGVSLETAQMAAGAAKAKAALKDVKQGSDQLDSALKKASKGSENFGFAAANMARQMDRLRMSYDPAYAASKRYEAAVEKVEKALAKNVITVDQYQDMLAGLSNKYLTVGNSANAFSGKLGFLGNMSGGAKSKIQQIGFQVQDFAVQVGSGTSATQAFGQQFPQLAGAFGPVGMAIGTLAAVGIPLLVAAFASGAAAGKSFEDTLNELKESLSSLQDVSNNYSPEGITALKEKYGELNEEILRNIELQRQLDMREALENSKNAIEAMAGEVNNFWTDQWNGLRDMFGLTVEQANLMDAALERAKKSGSFEDQVTAMTALREQILSATGGIDNMTSEQLAFYMKLQDSLDVMLQLRQSAAGAGWLSGMISEAQSLGTALWDALKAKAALANKDNMTVGNADWATNQLGFTLPGSELIPPNSNSASSGGGGSRSNPLQAKFDALQNSLMTEEQAEIESYARRQETLQQALQQKLTTQQEYNAMFEQLQKQHADKMTAIDVFRYGDTLDKATTFLGDMAAALQGGNDKMTKIAQKFAAAEALINAWRGFSQVLADPTLPWWAKIPQATAHLAAGMKAVSALGGSGGGGGGGGGGRGGAAAPAAASGGGNAGTYMNFQFNGGWTSTEQMGRFMVNAINQAVENGATIRGARIV